MRIALAFSALVLAAACSEDDRDARASGGWKYQPAHGANGAELSYNFGDGEGAEFVGMCRGEPDFYLRGGDYELGATQFSLTVDDRSWTLPAWHGQHGRSLQVDRFEQTVAIAKATRRIVFQVGKWKREVRPGSVLTKFVNDCG